MATNHIQPGKTMTYANDSGVDIASGDPVLIGSVLGVALVDIPDGSSGSVDVEEVYTVRKASDDITQGAKLYWDADGNPVGGPSGAGCLTTTDTENTYAGVAFEAAGAAASVVAVKLNA